MPMNAGEAALAGGGRFGRDPLTGLQSEHLFRLQLPTEFARARDEERNAALLAIRLDNILAINEKHGRSGGDEALRVLARVVEGVRVSAAEGAGHVAFRLGGPVFGYYLPRCSAPEARAVAEEIRGRVEHSQAFLEPLAVSIGVVNFYEFFLEDGSREQLAMRIERTALHRLDIAARMGGNTICDSSETSLDAVAKRPKVLIVDPEPEGMDLLVRSLEAADHEVWVCTDGESAMAVIEESPPSVIVCEAACPRIDGFAIRERLQANALWSGIPFILVSYRKNDELIRKAVQRDIRHFFRKPVSVLELAGLVSNITGRRVV